MKKIIAIVGSRRRTSVEDRALLVAKFAEIYNEGDWIVSGGCPTGADAYAEAIAKTMGITIIIHYPDWNKGKWAGLARNTDIAKTCDIVLAMPAYDRTGGTEDTIKKAEKLGKEIILV